jgi:hypothetical protein
MRISVLAILLAALVGASEAQQKKQHCTGALPDSLWLAQGPVYRDCEVDQKAELRGSEPRVDFRPATPVSARGTCYRAEMEFVVDTLGQPELSTLRARLSTDREFDEAVRASLPQLRYTPARLGDRPVRQLVLYKRAAAVMVVIAPAGSIPSRPSNARRPPGC